MDIQCLKDCLKNRIELKSSYPKLIGRHDYFENNTEKLERGIELLDKKELLTLKERQILYNIGRDFIIIRNNEIEFHNSRISTLYGNLVHDAETQLYSMALDVFQTHGVCENS